MENGVRNHIQHKKKSDMQISRGVSQFLHGTSYDWYLKTEHVFFSKMGKLSRLWVMDLTRVGLESGTFVVLVIDIVLDFDVKTIVLCPLSFVTIPSAASYATWQVATSVGCSVCQSLDSCKYGNSHIVLFAFSVDKIRLKCYDYLFYHWPWHFPPCPAQQVYPAGLYLRGRRLCITAHIKAYPSR